MSEDFISGLNDDLVEAMDRYERRSPRGRLAAGAYSQLLRPATLARVAAGAAIIVAFVAAVLTVARESGRPPAGGAGAAAAAAGQEVRHRRRFRDQVQPRRTGTHGAAAAKCFGPPIPAVSGARTSVTCGANGASPPSGFVQATALAWDAAPLTQHWPAGQMT